jgi:hypothetical protein
LCEQAADEIEALRGLVMDIFKAVTNKGSHPNYHDMIEHKHRVEWPYLWKQIDKLVKAVRDDRLV